MISITGFELIDLFFRFASVGSLLFILIFWISKNNLENLWIARIMMFCLAGYLFLTAPIDDRHYGALKGLFLFFTEILPYSLWLFVIGLIKPEFDFKNVSRFTKLSALCWIVWFVYFFGLNLGKGSFHQINHILGIIIWCHIAFMAVYDLQDDLVEERRKIRGGLAVFLGAYSSFLAVLEIFDFSWRSGPIFSLINSATIFTLIFLCTSWVSIKQKVLTRKDNVEVKLNQDALALIPRSFKVDFENMNRLMDTQFFVQSGLTIGVLANKLEIPEHRLRKLINKHLGYQNFSTFLNQYRIAAAQKILVDEAQLNVPILTIALELGYGSIGPFNRAFKQMTGLTPSEFRNNSKIGERFSK